MRIQFPQCIAFTLVCLATGCGVSKQATVFSNRPSDLNPSIVDKTTQPSQGTDSIANDANQPVMLANHVQIAMDSEAHKNRAQNEDQKSAFEKDGIVGLVESSASHDMERGALGGEVTLEELLELAFANNPAIKELALITQKAAGYRTQVGLYANPLLGYQGQQIADAGTDQHLLFVEQEIVTGGKLQLNRAVLNETLRAQLQELEAQKLRVATDIKMAFYDCVRMQQQLEAIDGFTILVREGVDTAEKRLKGGEGTRIDILQTQLQLKQLDLNRRQLIASLEARLREIVSLAGTPNMQLRGMVGELPSEPQMHDWKALEESLVSASPEYVAAQARIRQAMATIRRHEIQPIPNLGVQLGAGVDNGTNSGMLNVQVGAPIPVYNKNQGNIAAAKADYCRAIQDAQRIDNAIRARLAVASGEYMRSAEAVNLYTKELLPTARQTLELAEFAYKAGEQDFIQLLVTRRTYFDTNLGFIAARAQLGASQAQIDGYLLSGALNSVFDGTEGDALRGLTFSQQ